MLTGALLAATLLGPLLGGFLLWNFLIRPSRAWDDPEREAYVGRMCVAGAQLVAVLIALLATGPRIADAHDWRRPQVTVTAALAAALLIQTYLPLARRSVNRGARVASSWRYVYNFWHGVIITAPLAIAGVGGGALHSTSARLVAGLAAAVLDLTFRMTLSPRSFVRALTAPCDPEPRALITSLCTRHGTPVQQVRTIRFAGRSIVWAAVLKARSKHPVVIVSTKLLENFPQAEVEAIVLHEIGHLRAERKRRGLQVIALLASIYVYGFLALAPDMSVLVVAAVIPLSALVHKPKVVEREFAADAYAASVCGASAVADALTRLAEVNGFRLDGGAVTYIGASHPDVPARIARLRALANPVPPVQGTTSVSA